MFGALVQRWPILVYQYLKNRRKTWILFLKMAQEAKATNREQLFCQKTVNAKLSHQSGPRSKMRSVIS